MDDWEKRIVEDYPDQFKGPFALECGPGWAGLLHEMCRRVDLVLDDEWRKVFQWSQIKSKWGTVRAYSNGPDEVDEIVDWAEALSAITCERCGQPGRLRKTGWITVLCDEHAS